jgi:hypothetical protein
MFWNGIAGFTAFSKHAVSQPHVTSFLYRTIHENSSPRTKAAKSIGRKPYKTTHFLDRTGELPAVSHVL